MRTIVLDLETKKLFDEVKDGKHSLLGVSVVGIHDSAESSEEASFKAFLEHELANLWEILESADLIVGFNIKKFDWPVLQPYYSHNLYNLPTIDLLEVVRDSVGFRMKLQDLASATLGKGKTGTGLDAYHFYKQGQLDKLTEYCLNDVRLTRDLFLHAREHGILKYPDLGGQVKEFKVDLNLWLPKKEQSSKQQMSLGV